MRSLENSLEIKSKQGNYEVRFFSEIFQGLNELSSNYHDLYFIIDSNILKLFKNEFNQFIDHKILEVEGNEKFKTLSGIEKVSTWLLENKATKSSTLVAIGGGVIQDVATFVAHIYYRGIKWIYFPTTLLSQSDSCIGAKCGINLGNHKNQLGLLNSPNQVVIIEQFLNTLDSKNIESGFGEILKLSITGKNEFYHQLKNHLSTFSLTNNQMNNLIRASLNAKKYVIEIDEYESDLRRILNYGHSFGHALESLSKNNISHGHAILFGMDLINYIGMNWKITSNLFYLDFKNLIKTHFKHLNCDFKINSHELVDELQKDKKIKDGYMYFAIPRNIGEIEIIKYKIDSSLIDLVNQYLKDESIFNFN